MKNQLNLLPYSVLAMLFFISVESIAQAPQKFSSQIVVRNASNELVALDVVRVRVSLLQGTPEGSLSYSEIHLPFTNLNGLASMEIGEGTNVTGVFSDIDWSEGPYFLRTEIDPTGGMNFTISGTTEMLSVPYALHAGSDDDWIVDGANVSVPEGVNVGIGTSSPSAELTVVGSGLIDGVSIGTGPYSGTENNTYSTIIGHRALEDNTSGTYNTCVGEGSLWNNNSGAGNVSIGAFALPDNLSGSSLTAVGTGTGEGIQEGLQVTLLGNQATANDGLEFATAIGALAHVKQSNSLVLGHHGVKVGISANGRPHEMLEVGNTGRAFFGDGEEEFRKGLLIVGGQSATVARIEAYDYGAEAPMALGLNTTGGGVGIGMNNPSVALDVNGSIEYTGTITDVSDERLKENFLPISGAVESLLKIQGYTYTMKNAIPLMEGVPEGRGRNEREYGVIAQEIQKVFPEMVTVVDEENGYLGVSYVQLIPVLLEAIKEQQEDFERLKQENDALKASNETQAIENAQLNSSHALLQEKVKENNDSIQELKNILNSIAKK